MWRKKFGYFFSEGSFVGVLQRQVQDCMDHGPYMKASSVFTHNRFATGIRNFTHDCNYPTAICDCIRAAIDRDKNSFVRCFLNNFAVSKDPSAQKSDNHNGSALWGRFFDDFKPKNRNRAGSSVVLPSEAE